MKTLNKTFNALSVYPKSVQEFFRFMVGINAWNNFKEALFLYEDENIAAIDRIIKFESENFVMCAFRWNKTSHGSDYWGLVNRLWEEYLAGN